MEKTYIIAEAGVNHNANEALAHDLISHAKSAGADAIKFQLFKAESLVTQGAEQAPYQKTSMQESYKNQYEMLKALELPRDVFFRLKEYADSIGIDFLVTPFCIDSLDFLINDLGINTIKIGSGDIVHGPLLLKAAQSNVHLILSTGMSCLDEIEMALKVVAFGYLHMQGIPNAKSLDLVYEDTIAKQLLKEKVTLLHCTSEYPAPLNEINLRAIDTLRDHFGLKTGLSDHSQGLVAALGAVARGACVIEKHFTLNKNHIGPDHQASMDVAELVDLVQRIRDMEQVLGSPIKQPTASESKNFSLIRRGIVAKEKIKVGQVLSEENLTFKRPCIGNSPMSYWALLGQKAVKGFEIDESVA